MTTPNPALLGVPIELLRQRVCLTSSDDSRDAEIVAAFNVALDAVSDFLDRQLRRGEYTEIEQHFSASGLSLRAYPIMAVSVLISGDGYEPPFHLDKTRGWIRLDGHHSLHTLNCTYTGGYDVLPSSLLLAVLPVFDSAWSIMSNSSSGANAGKTIKSTTIDGTKVEYFDPNGSSNNTASSDFGIIPAATVELLQPYRRHSV